MNDLIMIDAMMREFARKRAESNPYLIPAELGGYIVAPSWEAVRDLMAKSGLPMQGEPMPPPIINQLFGVPIIIDEHAPDVAWYHRA